MNHLCLLPLSLSHTISFLCLSHLFAFLLLVTCPTFLKSRHKFFRLVSWRLSLRDFLRTNIFASEEWSVGSEYRQEEEDKAGKDSLNFEAQMDLGGKWN